MELTRCLPAHSIKEAVDLLVAQVKAELVRIVTTDADPNTNEDDIEVRTEEKGGLLWVIGKIIPEAEIDPDADPDSPYKVAFHTLASNDEG